MGRVVLDFLVAVAGRNRGKTALKTSHGHRLPGAKVTPLVLISDIAAHDPYHAGQIQLLTRLRPV